MQLKTKIISVILTALFSLTSFSASAKNTTHQSNAYRKNPDCRIIVKQCKQHGFVVGQHKVRNGLWMDCFNRILRGQTPIQRGNNVNIALDSQVIQSCKAAKH